MKIDGYSTRRINKNMYRIVDHNGTPVGSIQRNKEAANRPGTGRWHAYGNRKLTDYKGREALGNSLREVLTVFVQTPCVTYVIINP